MLPGGTLAACHLGWPTPLWPPAPTPIISSGRPTFLGARTVERAASPHHKEGAARMTPIDPVVGIDCGKRYLDAALFPGTDRTRVENTPHGLATLVIWLAERGVRVAGLEASGGCERLARDALIEPFLTVRIFEPGRVRHFAGAKGRRAKTDAIDAALIAEFTAAFPESPPAVRDPAREQLAGLVRARRLVVTKQADLV